MKADYIRITTTGPGHWRVVVERFNFSPKTKRITSSTIWTVDTTDSMSIDAYRSSDEKRFNDGQRRLVWQAKTYGTKEIIRRI